MKNEGGALEAFFNSPHVGEVSEPRFVGRSASFQCGAVLRVSLNINESQRITDAKFRAAGCSFLVASASLLIDEVIGKTTGEAAAIAQSVGELEARFLDQATDRSECVTLAHEALLSAIRSYSDSARDEWSGDEALICTCFCVSERRIEREIQEKGLRTIADVTASCNAGAGCRSCYPLIEDILAMVNGKW
jgi:NifU-like protein